MIILFALAILVLAVLWAVGRLHRTKPGIAARLVRSSGGLAVLAIALFLLMRGQLDLAIGLGVFGLGLLGWSGISQWLGRAGGVSRVAGPMIAVEIDGRSGAMQGTILSGRYQGMPLDALDKNTLVSLLGECDGESRALLAAYLDRRHPGWREHAQGHAASGRASSTGKMSEQEAYQILGVQPGASAADISRAHRSLMKKLHPDQGGSTYLAARVNEAKETLSRQHRR